MVAAPCIGVTVAPMRRPQLIAAAGICRSNAPPLVVRNVWKTFTAGTRECAASVRVLTGVSLEVAAGEVVGIGGAAGSGKSTLLGCAAGLLLPDRGSVSAAVGVTPLYLDLRLPQARRELEFALTVDARLILVDHVTRRDLELIRAAFERSRGDRHRPVILRGEPGAGPVAERIAARAEPGCERTSASRTTLVLAGRECPELALLASRVFELREGQLRARATRGIAPWLDAQRKRSAARTSSEFPMAFARVRMRSTSGRSLRSPQ